MVLKYCNGKHLNKTQKRHKTMPKIENYIEYTLSMSTC